MKKNAHGNRKRNMLKATACLHDHTGVTPWETMALIRMMWDEELAA